MFYTFQKQHKSFNANFHTGKIVYDEDKEFNWVYDCGSKSLARQYLKTVDKVDVIFISHFDGDHINGLPIFLASPQARGARIIVPYLTNEDIVILFSKGYMASLLKSGKEDDILWRFFKQLPNAKSDSGDNEENNREKIIDLSENLECGDGYNIIPLKQKITYSLLFRYGSLDKIWIFKTHVFEETKLKNKLSPLLSGSGTSLTNELKNNFNSFVKNLKDLYKNEIKKIKKALGTGSSNVMTMSMISMPYNSPRLYICNHCFSAWLHTGDAFLSDKDIGRDFESFLRPYARKINFCVLPHHASRKSMNLQLFKNLKDDCNYIITPSSRVAFSCPSVKNLFCVAKLDFQTIYMPCFCCKYYPLINYCTRILRGKRISYMCRGAKKCPRTCKK